MYATGTLYTFIERGTEITLLRTTDVRELLAILPGDWIAEGEALNINGSGYTIDYIVIEPFETPASRFHPEPNHPEIDKGEGYYFSIQCRVYATPKK